MDASWIDKEKESSRLLWLDFGKAIGILVVLIVHAGCSLGPVTFYGGMFYMPVFFVAAGYTYRYRPEEGFGGFVKKKAKRLLVPYFVVSAFLWLFFWVKDSVLAGNPGDLKIRSLFGILYSRYQLQPVNLLSLGQDDLPLLDLLNSPLWFLTALFLVYVYYELIRRIGKKYLWLALGLLLAVLWHYTFTRLLPWSIDAVPYFAVYFAFGEWLRERDVIPFLKKRWYLNLILLALFVFLANLNSGMNLSCGVYGNSMLLGLFVGALGSVLIFLAGVGLEALCPPLVRFFSLIGQQTLPILCFHMFLFMFLRGGAELIGLSEGVTQALLVVGSAAVLTVAGCAAGKKSGCKM